MKKQILLSILFAALAFFSCINIAGAQITGTLTVCVGSTTTLTDATPGGTWSSSAPGIATVDTGGVVTGMGAGTATIIYSTGSGLATAIVTVQTLPTPPHAITFTGTASVCVGATITIHDVTLGDTWSSADPLVATVMSTVSSTLGASAVVRGVSPGVVLISYSKTNSCGTVAVTLPVTVNPLPVVSAITGGSSSICSGTTTTFVDTTSGGTWSSSVTSAATIDPSTGIATGIATGVTTIEYSVTNACGTAMASTTLSVTSSATAGVIAGGPMACIGTPLTLTDGVSGGTWTSSNTNATITGTGVVSGVTSGTDTISYSVSTTCGSADTTLVITIGIPSDPGTITGPDTVCVGSAITLSDAATGGTWSSSSGSAAVSSGIVTGITAGTAVISYSVPSTCGTFSATENIVVYPLPDATITGTSSTVCAGSTLTLSTVTSGGTWTSSDPAIATISASGVITGVSDGTAIISYSLTTPCGSPSSAFTVTVISAPTSAGTISGSDTVCITGTITLSETLTGGIWGAQNADASVSAGGVVTGVTAGVDTIFYTIANLCGSISTSQLLTVEASCVPVGIIGAKNTLGTVLAIYPNPNMGVFTIQLPEAADKAVISVFDLLGDLVDMKTVTAGSANIDYNLTKLPAGSYIIKINTGDKVYRDKVVIW